MTMYGPQHIAVTVHGPQQGPGGPADTTWIVLARYTQPDTNTQRDLFAIIYSDEKEGAGVRAITRCYFSDGAASGYTLTRRRGQEASV